MGPTGKENRRYIFIDSKPAMAIRQMKTKKEIIPIVLRTEMYVDMGIMRTMKYLPFIESEIHWKSAHTEKK